MEYIVTAAVADDVVFMGRNGHFCRGRSDRQTLENLKWVFQV